MNREFWFKVFCVKEDSLLDIIRVYPSIYHKHLSSSGSLRAEGTYKKAQGVRDSKATARYIITHNGQLRDTTSPHYLFVDLRGKLMQT